MVWPWSQRWRPPTYISSRHQSTKVAAWNRANPCFAVAASAIAPKRLCFSQTGIAVQVPSVERRALIELLSFLAWTIRMVGIHSVLAGPTRGLHCQGGCLAGLLVFGVAAATADDDHHHHRHHHHHQHGGFPDAVATLRKVRKNPICPPLFLSYPPSPCLAQPPCFASSRLLDHTQRFVQDPLCIPHPSLRPAHTSWHPHLFLSLPLLPS